MNTRANIGERLTLAAAKARALRRLSVRYHDAFLAEMRLLGWRYTEEPDVTSQDQGQSGRPRQWHPSSH
jgi:hypothetical protein